MRILVLFLVAFCGIFLQATFGDRLLGQQIPAGDIEMQLIGAAVFDLVDIFEPGETTPIDLPGVEFFAPSGPAVTFNIPSSISVPEDGTLLIGGIKRLREFRLETGVPVLLKLPYIARLFKNVGINRETSLMMRNAGPGLVEVVGGQLRIDAIVEFTRVSDGFSFSQPQTFNLDIDPNGLNFIQVSPNKIEDALFFYQGSQLNLAKIAIPEPAGFLVLCAIAGIATVLTGRRREYSFD